MDLVNDLQKQVDLLQKSLEKLKEMVETKELNPNQIACFEKCVNYLKSKNSKQLSL